MRTQVSVADRFLEAVSTASYDDLAALYHPDVLADVNVPQWRFQISGRDALVDVFRTEYTPDMRITSSRAEDAGVWQIVQVEGRYGSGEQERMFREVHLLHLTDGLIDEQVSYCSGMWDAETIRRQAAEAPMYRP